VAPTLWLGRDLAARVDAQRLAAVADVSPCSDATRLQLRADRGLADLEDALAPILPR
jgi:hypothetical protein